jgi:lipopolysaccharide export system protein LptA
MILVPWRTIPQWRSSLLATPLMLGSMVLPLALTPLALGVVTLMTSPTAQAQSDGGSITLRADVQEANANTGIITARGNVRIDYPARQIVATSTQAQYYSRERRIILTGNVHIQQEGNSIRAETVTYLIDEGRFVATPNTSQQVESIYIVPESEVAPAGDDPSQSLPPLPNPAEEPIPTDLPAADRL